MSETKYTNDDPPPYPGLSSTAYPPLTQQYAPPAQSQQYQPYPQGGYPPPQQGQGQQEVVVVAQPASTVIIRAGNCPNCRVGVLCDHFTCCGILLAIFFFPFGLICCSMMRNKVCNNCRATFK